MKHLILSLTFLLFLTGITKTLMPPPIGTDPTTEKFETPLTQEVAPPDSISNLTGVWISDSSHFRIDFISDSTIDRKQAFFYEPFGMPYLSPTEYLHPVILSELNDSLFEFRYYGTWGQFRSTRIQLLSVTKDSL